MADDGQYDSQINLEPEEYEQETTIEQEEYELETTIEQGDSEQEITMQPEAATVYGGSVVNSINGQVGDVILTTSDLENTSDYQTGAQVRSAIEGKQDKLTAGTNIQINNDVISATDTTYSEGSGLNLDGTTFSVDTNIIATVQDVTNEATTRENSDANLQGQIDALTVSSDVIDVLGTYQDLQNYDTSHVKVNDIIKVLQDSTHNNAMSYYRWVATSNAGSWVYVGSEGPYYTKSEADALLNDKQNTEDNSLDTTSKTVVGAINEVNSIAKGSNQALSFANYSAMVTEFNSLTGDEYSVGQNIMVVTLEVPDLWISGIESTSSTYTYTTDEAFITAMATNGYVQVGYYKLSALETQKVDLTDYVTNTDYASNNTGGVVKTNTNYGTSVDSNGSLRGTTKTYAEYGSMHSLGLISKVTLENVIEGKGLVSNTDYGSFATAGVVKASSTYGTQFASTGAMYAQTKTYEQYTDSTSPGLFIGKGTLENVITGKGLVSNTDYADNDTGGVIKVGSSYGTSTASSGNLIASVKTYEDYSRAGNYMLVGKGTLENVIEGKGLVDQTALAGKQDKLTAGTNITIDANNVISATGGGGGDDSKYYFGTCATGASTRAKVVECEGFTLEEGATISVYFTNGQSYNGYPQLNVNGTGNVAVVYKGGSAGIRYMWSAGEIIDFTYHNEYWVCHGRALATTTYYGVTKLSNSAISTSTSLALTPAVVNAVAENMITGYDAYSASKTYAVGDRVRYSSYAYECITAIPTAESWTAAHWTPIDPLQTQIDAINTTIGDIDTILTRLTTGSGV